MNSCMMDITNLQRTALATVEGNLMGSSRAAGLYIQSTMIKSISERNVILHKLGNNKAPHYHPYTAVSGRSMARIFPADEPSSSTMSRASCGQGGNFRGPR